MLKNFNKKQINKNLWVKIFLNKIKINIQSQNYYTHMVYKFKLGSIDMVSMCLRGWWLFFKVFFA